LRVDEGLAWKWFEMGMVKQRRICKKCCPYYFEDELDGSRKELKRVVFDG